MPHIIRDHSAQEFLTKTHDLLYAHEAIHSLMLGVIGGLVRAAPKAEPVLVRVVKGEETIAAAVQTLPLNLVLSFASEVNLDQMITFFDEQHLDFPGVVGPAKEVEYFSLKWAALRNKTARLGMAQKIYRLTHVTMPQVEGQLRMASRDDEDVFCDWMVRFSEESLPAFDQKGESYWREFCQRMLNDQRVHFWIHEGKPVSVAVASRPTMNGISISMVFTPELHRRKGYASAVTAHLSQKMLESGKKFCVLYTDKANPTSNKIYQRMGYEPIADSAHYLFV